MLSKKNLSVILVVSICCLIFTSGCGSDPCSNKKCPDICRGEELWSQVCENGQCIYYKQVSNCSTACGCTPQATTTAQNTQSTTTKSTPKQTPEAIEEAIKLTKYSNEMMEIMYTLTDSGEYCVNLVLNKPSGPKYWTDNEILMFALHTVRIEETYERARALEVPIGYENIHQETLNGLRKFSLAMPLFREGIYKMDVETIRRADRLIKEGRAHLENVAKLMDER